MSESSRTINHKLNELLSKNNISKTKLDASTALAYASVLKTNILGKDKQEKVNSIVVLAKLLDCILGSESVSNEFSKVLDHTVFSTLFSIVSAHMSTETYKAILKISVILISGSIFRSKTDSIDNYLPLYESLIEYLDVIDIMTQKLYLQDNKITYNSIKLVTDLINKALLCGYDGIITLAGRLKHVTFFSTVGNLIETDDKSILDSISHLKVAYYSLNEYLNATTFDLSIKSHQVMLNNLFIFLEVSLNEYGTPATTEEYVKAGFTEDPRNFVVQNFTILLAMDLKIFVKDPNFTFKKRFHEELMMSDHNRTFPLFLFIQKATDMWLQIFHSKDQYPHIYSSILSWELMIYYTMNNCLILWQETKSRLENPSDIDSIMELLEAQVSQLNEDLGKGNKSVEECLDLTTKDLETLRQVQIQKISDAHSSKWASRLVEFDSVLAREVMDFVCEQRVVQLLKGSWVYTESYGEQMLRSNSSHSGVGNKYYFIMLAPNRKFVYYKEFVEKSLVNPTYEDMEEQAIPLADIVDFKASKAGEHVGESDKKQNSMLVSVKGTISHENIVLIGAKGRHLLSFYTDTQVSKYVWLDGLKMLKGMWAGRLSDDTEKQVEALIEMRKNTQLLDLEHKAIGGELEYEYDSDDDDDEFYDIKELANVTGFRDEHRISHLTASTMAKKHRDDFVMTIDSDSEASDGGDSGTEQKTGDLNPDFVFGEAEETAFTGWDLDQKDVANHKDVDLDGILRSKGGLSGMIDGEEEEQKEEEEENEDNAEDEEEVNAGEDDEDLAMDGFGMGAEQEDDEEEENSEQENEHEAESEDEQEQEDSENDEDSAAAIAEFYEESKTTEKITSFQALQLSRPLLKGVGNLGYTVPSAIQAASIPIAMMGKDIVAGAVTGSGKTAAYLIPIIERLIYKPAAVSATRVIVLTPTRELAIQVCDVGKKLGQFVANLNFGLAVGGLNLRQQEQQLKSRPDIVVATPGRLIDHIRNSPSFSIENLEVLVMDEADRMLEEGFQVELTEILELIPKHKRQTMLFSATMNTKIQDLIQLSLDKPVRIMVNPPKQAASKLVQEFVRIRKREHLKPALLYHLLRLVDPQQQNRIVVFVSRKEMAHRLRIVLGLLGMKVSELHGSLTQEQRLQSVKDFRSLAVPVLICTDLAARGLDIPKIEIVINFDMPKTHEIYLHRVGRTARAGREGRSITFVGESNQDRSIVKDAIKSLEEQKNGKAVSRTVDWKKVEELNSIVESKKDTIDEVLEEEKSAKEILQAEMQLEKASNIMKHEKEIHSRPKRTWFQSEQEKKQAQRTPVMQSLAKHGKKVNSKKRKAHEERKEEKRSYKKTKSDRSAPKTKAKSKKRK